MEANENVGIGRTPVRGGMPSGDGYVSIGGLALLKDFYEDGLCPDCGEPIPDDAVEGEACHNCGHVFSEPRPDDVYEHYSDAARFDLPEDF